MTRNQRRAHAAIWALLLPGLVGLVWWLLATRPEPVTPIQTAPAADGSEGAAP